MIPPLGPIMLKDRISMIFLRYGHLDVIDGAFVLVDQNGVRISGTRLIVKFVLAKSSHNHYFRLFKQTSLQFLDLL